VKQIEKTIMKMAVLPHNVLNTLKTIGYDDYSTMNTLISLYKEQAPEMIATIKLSASQQESHELHDAAHAYKGVCMNLGFTPLRDVCYDIENAVIKKDYLRINALCTQLEYIHNEIVSQIITLNHG
jgi:HPt (histidine-containing phosphotransfer) domain-containing protein